MVTQSHKIIYFTKVSPKSSPSMPSIFPKRSREKKKTTKKPLHISFTEEKQKQTDLFHALAYEFQQRAKKREVRAEVGRKSNKDEEISEQLLGNQRQ